MRKSTSLAIFFCLVVIVGVFTGKGAVEASEIDRDPMIGSSMSPEWDRDIYSDILLAAGSNNYVSITEEKRGIDVSKWQGDINWKKVKESGVEFAFIRVGYRGLDKGTLVEDPYFKQNIEEATAEGIKVGVYIFSQAISNAEAIEEAEFIINHIKGYNITLPVVIDYEFGEGMTGRLANAKLSKEQGTEVCKAFCAKVESCGYTGMVYANKNMLTYYINGPQIADEYLIWLAQYNSVVTYAGKYNFWQYSSKGSVPGISGSVDMNYWYIKDGVEDFSKEGLYYDDDHGWAYYSKGAIDISYTGIAENENGKWYVKTGLVDFSYSGLAMSEDGKWYYIVNGKVDDTYTGMVYGGNDVWYFAKNGQIDLSYTGMASNENGWWYYKSGVLDWRYTGLASNENGTWYYENGQIAWNFSGLAYIDGKYWKIEKGKLDSEYSELYESKELGWVLVNDGVVDTGYSDLYYSPQCGWWKVNNGYVDFNYSDLYFSQKYGWWKIVGGTVDFGYRGLYESKTYGWWLVNEGAVNFGYNDLYYDIDHGWWKVANGTVDFSYSGLYQSEKYDWWLINNGTVCFEYSDLYFDSNCGWWKVNSGYVDFWYDGWYNSPMYGNWYVHNGAVYP